MKFYDKVCPVCNKVFKGTKMRKFCSDKCLYESREKIVQVTCKDCGKVDIVPKYYCNRCKDCHKVVEEKYRAKKQNSKIKSTPQKQLTTWEQYAQWHKANPRKNYGDYQIMKRKELGEICQQ